MCSLKNYICIHLCASFFFSSTSPLPTWYLSEFFGSNQLSLNIEKMRKTPIVEKQLLLPFVLITSLFFMWGLANNMTDTLLAAFKRILSMTDFQTSWIQIAFYGSYFCLALPAAILIKKFSYKTGVLAGLGIFIGGALLFYPASISMSYSFFLIALF